MKRNFGFIPNENIDFATISRELNAIVWLCLANLFATAVQIGIALYELLHRSAT